MKANWIKQTTATTGTGTMTLGAAMAGFIALSDRSDMLPDGAQVRYQIVDGNNREEGIGTYTASGTTLSRDTIIETLVAGVYDNTSPVAITLSGSATVAIAASANTGFDGRGLQFSAARICYPDNIIKLDGVNQTGAVGRIEYFPAYLLFPRFLSSLAIECGVADAAAVDSRIGIWNQNANALPGQLLYGSSALDLSAVAIVTEVLPDALMLPAGVYWFGIRTDSATVGVGKASISGGQIWGAPHGMRTDVGRMRVPYTDGTSGAFTSNPTITGESTLSNARIFGWQS
jgi:hypothetical protein